MNESIHIITINPNSSENSSETSKEFSVRDKINYQLLTGLSENPLSLPDAIIQKVRQILLRNGFEMSSIKNLDTLGEELIIELDQNESRIHGPIEHNLYLYLIYYLTDDKNYDIFAEVIDEGEVQEILNNVDEEDLEEED